MSFDYLKKVDQEADIWQERADKINVALMCENENCCDLIIKHLGLQLVIAGHGFFSKHSQSVEFG